MTEITGLIEENFEILAAVAFAWILLIIVASAFYRHLKGKPLFPGQLPDSLFSEAWASGRSNKNMMTKLGGARNCLLVSANEKTVQITPRFPFNLMFLPEVYDLEYQIPKNKILSVTRERKMGVEMIELRFLDDSGDEKSVALKLRNPEQFLSLVR